MDIQSFIGKDVIIAKTKTPCVLTEITAPYIKVQTKAPNSSGYPSTYRFETLNGDPFARNVLVFEDESMREPFIKVFTEYCSSKEARYEEMDYWMRKD